jgi:hypothetical protein
LDLKSFGVGSEISLPHPSLSLPPPLVSFGFGGGGFLDFDLSVDSPYSRFFILLGAAGHYNVYRRGVLPGCKGSPRVYP